MIALKLQVKKIGNSLGFILPKDIVKKARIREKKQVEILLNEPLQDDMFEKSFGILKTNKTADEINDLTNEAEL